MRRFRQLHENLIPERYESLDKKSVIVDNVFYIVTLVYVYEYVTFIA